MEHKHLLFSQNRILLIFKTNLDFISDIINCFRFNFGFFLNFSIISIRLGVFEDLSFPKFNQLFESFDVFFEILNCKKSSSDKESTQTSEKNQSERDEHLCYVWHLRVSVQLVTVVDKEP